MIVALVLADGRHGVAVVVVIPVGVVEILGRVHDSRLILEDHKPERVH